MVVERSDRETVRNWSCTSKFYYNIAADVIWNSFAVYDPKPGRAWYRIDALRYKIRFQTKSPAQRVKTLAYFATQDGLGFDAVIERRLATRCMTDALKCMPNLQIVALEGHVHPDGFDALSQNKQLQKLRLRLCSEYLRFDKDVPEEPSCSYTLNFAPLAGITSLRTLLVGRLTPREAPGLALAIRDLQLISLMVFAAPPADSVDPRKSYAGMGDDISPIQKILESLLTSRGGRSGHLPLSLQDITLRDFYRPFKSSNNDLLVNTIRPVNVSKLELCVVATKQLIHFFHHAPFPNLTSFALSGCRHFLPDNAWMALGLDFDKDAPIDPPAIPMYGSFLGFLGCHRQSLESLTMSHILSFGRPGDEGLLYFEKDDLKRLGDPGRGLTPQEFEAPLLLGTRRVEPHNQLAWVFSNWTHSCSQVPSDDEAFSSCLCVEKEHGITIRLIEARDDFVDEDEDEYGDEDEDEDVDEDDEEVEEKAYEEILHEAYEAYEDYKEAQNLMAEAE